MATKNRFEVLGLAIEMGGLLALLSASIWQFNVTNWIDQTAVEWQAFIQEGVNIQVMESQLELARMLATNDAKLKVDTLAQIEKHTSEALTTAIEERDKRAAFFKNGQGHYLPMIRMVLLLAGAAALVLGKGLAYYGARVALTKPS